MQFRKIAGNSILVLVAILMSSLMVLIGSIPSLAQIAPDDYMSELEQARRLEREIAVLEGQLAKAKRDWITISQSFQEIEKRILDCYLQIDVAEAQVENARRSLNSKLRYLYMEGRKDALVELFSSSDVSELVTKYDYVLHTAKQESNAFRALKDKRERLRETQEQLIAYKQEQSRLARGMDMSSIELLIEQKKNELADLNGVIIAGQTPSTQTPAPTDFSPNRVYQQPDEDGFVRTGQMMSGYSSWYGNEFHGRPTASGEVFDQYGFTCAHKTLPFGTRLRVTFRGRVIIVKVNDRGPFVKGRMLDLSRGAAEAVGLAGVQWVDCEIVVPKS